MVEVRRGRKDSLWVLIPGGKSTRAGRGGVVGSVRSPGSINVLLAAKNQFIAPPGPTRHRLDDAQNPAAGGTSFQETCRRNGALSQFSLTQDLFQVTPLLAALFRGQRTETCALYFLYFFSAAWVCLVLHQKVALCINHTLFHSLLIDSAIFSALQVAAASNRQLRTKNRNRFLGTSSLSFPSAHLV